MKPVLGLFIDFTNGFLSCVYSPWLASYTYLTDSWLKMNENYLVYLWNERDLLSSSNSTKSYQFSGLWNPGEKKKLGHSGRAQSHDALGPGFNAQYRRGSWGNKWREDSITPISFVLVLLILVCAWVFCSNACLELQAQCPKRPEKEECWIPWGWSYRLMWTTM